MNTMISAVVVVQPHARNQSILTVAVNNLALTVLRQKKTYLLVYSIAIV